jgi:hypothetical protein
MGGLLTGTNDQEMAPFLEEHSPGQENGPSPLCLYRTWLQQGERRYSN